MCRRLTYRGDPIHLDSVIFEKTRWLIHQSINARHSHVTTNGDGFGVGWYAERNTPGVFRDILPAWNDSDLRSITHPIRSGLFFAHVRAAMRGEDRPVVSEPLDDDTGGWQEVPPDHVSVTERRGGVEISPLRL